LDEQAGWRMRAMTDTTPSFWRRSARHTLEGQVVVIFAIASLALVAAVALAVDAGYLMSERRQVQAAADAAAMAAARASLDNKASAEILGTGQSYGAFNAGVATGNVAVSRPPATGAYAGNNSYVQVTITKDVTRFFVGAIYTGNWSVSASATAGIETNPGNYALIALERNATDGIYLNGTVGIGISLNGGSAMANSNIRGSNNTDFDTAGTIDANSTIQQGSGWSAPGGIHPNTPEVDDPLAGTPVPPKGTSRTFPSCNSGCTLQPGWYDSQSLTVKDTATLQPGIYYFENSAIDLQNTNARIQCTGCLVYFDADSTFDPKNGQVSFTAPTTVPYTNGANGMVFWYAGCNTLDLQGNGDMYFQGVFYAPCAYVWMHGNPSSDTVNGQVFVNRLDVRGTSDLRISYHSYVDTPKKAVFLVE
jgi:Flp pilus assembly protein TadG